MCLRVVVLLGVVLQGVLGMQPACPVRLPTSLPNFRDLGNTPVAGGRVIKPGLLWRSASPANISEADAKIMLGSSSCVLDLRDRHDAEKDVGARLLAPATQHLPLLSEKSMRSALVARFRSRPLQMLRLLSLGAAKKLSPSSRIRHRLGEAVDTHLCKLLDQVSLADVYCLILTERAYEVRTALELCSAQFASEDEHGRPSPILVHCLHGKDRTGVLVALLLFICGVPEEEILLDYARSHEFGCSEGGQWAMYQALPANVRARVHPTMIHEWCAAPESELADALNRVKAEFGSMDRYLDHIGVDAALRSSIATRLTEEAGSTLA
jgi:protein tyrosine/serine phosphatase